MHTKALIFDYGGTLDTRGNHWGKVIWHAYQQMGVPVSEQQFRDAYVYAERTLGRNPIIRPSYTFKLTLDVKLRLQLEYLAREFACDVQQGGEGIETPCATPEVQSPLAQLLSDSKAFKKIHQQLLFHLYDEVRQTVAESKAVLTQLAETYPMVLVSNFYGNVETVLHEMHLNHLFSHVIESAVVGIRKPDPQIFQLAVEALQRDFQASSGEQLQPQDILVVGDSMSKDIVPARSLMCQTAWYKGEGWTDKAEDETIPTHVITSLEQLVNLLSPFHSAK